MPRFTPSILRRPPSWALALSGLLVILASLVWPLPEGLLDERAVTSLRVTDRQGALLQEIRPAGRGVPVPLEAIPEDAVAALIATEDRHFYRHPGVDPLAIGRALWQNLRSGQITSGASTITMQVARSLRGRSERGWWDKLLEMHLAIRLEVYLRKPEILTLWLNRVPFGNQTHGIESAAQLYVGKPARDLTLHEASFLIGLPQSPSAYDPFRHLDRAHARHEQVLAALERSGRLSPSERHRLSTLPLALQDPEQHVHAPHFVRSVIPPDARDLSEIRTTLDRHLQQVVAEQVRGHLRLLDDASVTNAAAVVLDNASGDVLAYVGSADFWDDRHGGQNDGVRMLRQPGSALKPFTYAMALASGRYTPASVLADLEVQVLEAGGAFSPQNYDNTYHGPVSLRQALACSYNIPAVRIARAFGPDRLLDQLHRAGFASLRQPAAFYGVGLTLGNGEVQLLELARAYAGLARGGSLPPVRTVRWQRTLAHDTLAVPIDPPQPMGLSPQVAYLISDILSDPEARAPAFGRGGPLELPFPAAVKTGTSKDYRDNWAVGYTPRHTVAVWVGNFDGSPMRWVSGVSGAGPILNSVLRHLGPGGAFPHPDGIVTAEISPASGLRPGPHTPNRKRELFLVGTVPTDTCTVHQRIPIDRRTGLRATASTPPAFVESPLFAVYPPEYHGWMRDQGLPLPPPEQPEPARAHSDSVRYSEALAVQYPETGTVFQVDPVLRAEHQQIHLKGEIAASLFDVQWWVNEAPLDGSVEDAYLPLTPGTHEIELRAVDATGQRIRSRPVTITVRGTG